MSSKTVVDSRFHAVNLSDGVGRIGNEGRPRPKRWHASTGAYPTEAMTIGRGASMVLNQFPGRN